MKNIFKNTYFELKTHISFYSLLLLYIYMFSKSEQIFVPGFLEMKVFSFQFFLFGLISYALSNIAYNSYKKDHIDIEIFKKSTTYIMFISLAVGLNKSNDQGYFDFILFGFLYISIPIYIGALLKINNLSNPETLKLDSSTFNTEHYDEKVREWYYTDGVDRIGPLTYGEFKRRLVDNTINLDTYIWKKGMSDWKKLFDYLKDKVGSYNSPQ